MPVTRGWRSSVKTRELHSLGLFATGKSTSQVRMSQTLSSQTSAVAEISRGYAYLDYAKVAQQPTGRYRELRNVLDCWNRAMDLGLETVPSIMKTVEPDLYFSISLELYRKLNEAPQAVRDFSRVLSLDPKFIRAYAERGKAWLDVRGKSNPAPKSAIDDFTMAITLGCNDPDVFEIRGQCYDQIGQYKLAAIDFTRALELAPDRHFDYYHRANVFRKGKQYLAAKQDYQKILSVSSNSKLVDLAQTRLQDISDLVDVDTSAPPLVATATSVVEPKDQTTKETPRIWGWLQRIGKKHRQEGI